MTRKDVRVEARSWEMLSTTLFFAASCVLVFSFAFVRQGRPIEGAAAGIVWIAIAFSGTLALGRAFERERHQDAMRGLLMAPVERSAIFLGKLLGIVLLMSVVELIVVLFVAFTFRAPLFVHPIYLAVLMLAGTVGFCGRSAHFLPRCFYGREVVGCSYQFCCIQSRFRC